MQQVSYKIPNLDKSSLIGLHTAECGTRVYLAHASKVDPTLVSQADVVLSCFYKGEKSPFEDNRYFSVQVSYRNGWLSASCHKREEGEPCPFQAAIQRGMHYGNTPYPSPSFRQFRELAFARASVLIEQGYSPEEVWYMLDDGLPEQYSNYSEYLLRIVCDAFSQDGNGLTLFYEITSY